MLGKPVLLTHLKLVCLCHLGVTKRADVFGDGAVLLAEHELGLELLVAERAELLRHPVLLAVEARVLGGRCLAAEAYPGRKLLGVDSGPSGHPRRADHGDGKAREGRHENGQE
jgi:hypothetical protein